ncbi:MAG: nicotinate-nucleotide diphosphorylase (carboxylating), partial [Muribaculaceae bacterium]|nr:nicotinate-nucleotide diphosphorylase (carboxylating) [Muribaculaceae bacterium]
HNAVEAARKWCAENGKDLRIEVETRNEDEIRQALAEKVDRILLDNFTPERTAGAVKIIREDDARTRRHTEIESSGGITIDTLRQYGETGVDFISVGALTHSVKGLDMSFKAF